MMFMESEVLLGKKETRAESNKRSIGCQTEDCRSQSFSFFLTCQPLATCRRSGDATRLSREGRPELTDTLRSRATAGEGTPERHTACSSRTLGCAHIPLG